MRNLALIGIGFAAAITVVLTSSAWSIGANEDLIKCQVELAFVQDQILNWQDYCSANVTRGDEPYDDYAEVDCQFPDPET